MTMNYLFENCLVGCIMTRDFKEAIVVNSVPEEYAIVRTQICNCGSTYKVKTQSLVEDNDKMYDILHCTCNACGLEREFIFDINSFFGKFFPKFF